MHPSDLCVHATVEQQDLKVEPQRHEERKTGKQRDLKAGMNPSTPNSWNEIGRDGLIKVIGKAIKIINEQNGLKHAASFL